jgi:hypothetical protein
LFWAQETFENETVPSPEKNVFHTFNKVYLLMVVQKVEPIFALPHLSQKMKLALKMVKFDSKIIISIQ